MTPFDTPSAFRSFSSPRRARESHREFVLTPLACLAIVLLLLASAERRVWESGLDDPTTALLDGEPDGKVVSLLVDVDRVDVPWVPGIDVALERQHSALPPGAPPHVAIPRPGTRAPPLI